MKRLHTDTRIGIALLIVAAIIIGFQMQGCSGIQIVKPGPPELADLAWSTTETVIVFLPGKYRDWVKEWQPDVEELKAMLENDEPITGEWCKEKFLDKLAGCIISVLSESSDLSEIEKQVLIDDFNRSLGIIQVEGEIVLNPDQRTVLYGAVNGVLSGLARFEDDPLAAKMKMRKELK